MIPGMIEEQLGVQEETPAKIKRNTRSIALSVDFTDGFAAGWVMAVPAWFREELDIELTERVQKHPVTGEKQSVMVWTEGRPSLYGFSAGAILYNTKAAYEKKWGDALSKISVALQIVDATADRLNEKNSKISGSVRFSVLRPRKDRSRIEIVSKHTMSQDEFVGLLKSGIMPDGTILASDE